MSMKFERLFLLVVVAFLAVSGCGDTSDDSTSDEGWEQSNSAPDQPEVTIAPSTPTTEDDLEANLAVESEDPDGDDVTYEYRWVKDGSRQEGLDSKTVNAY